MIDKMIDPPCLLYGTVESVGIGKDNPSFFFFYRNNDQLIYIYW